MRWPRVPVPIERWLIDTNVWIFGLRRNPQFSDSIKVLTNIGSFLALVPLQIITELPVNLRDEEMAEFYRLRNEYGEYVSVSWEAVAVERVRFYQRRGCRKGDALVAAHAEALSADLIVSNNRQFLGAIQNLPFTIATPAEALSRLSPS